MVKSRHHSGQRPEKQVDEQRRRCGGFLVRDPISACGIRLIRNNTVQSLISNWGPPPDQRIEARIRAGQGQAAAGRLVGETEAGDSSISQNDVCSKGDTYAGRSHRRSFSSDSDRFAPFDPRLSYLYSPLFENLEGFS